MCRAARDDLEYALILQLAKGINEISVVAIIPKIVGSPEVIHVHFRNGMKLGGLASCSMFLFRGQVDKIFEVPGIAVLQQFVSQHLAKRRRDVHCKSRRRAGLVQRLEDEDQRKIDFGDGLVKPVFLEEFRIFGMPHERQMGVQN
jgi:hypothetical protein